MKNLKILISSGSIAVALFANARTQSADAPAPAAAPATNTPAATAPPMLLKDGTPGLRLNFRGVPLEMVLDYLSDAAGFIIVKDTDVKGKVDVWSNQPLNKDEAVDLLNTVLNQNGYAAIRHERTLRIKTLAEAKKSDIPVKNGNIPSGIPKTDEMITQVIPVRHVNASQLIQNLNQLLPDYATLTANDSGNALILTDTQADVHRMVEIVNALDLSLAGTSMLRVFGLRYADAKDLASAFKDLFAPAAVQQGAGGRGGAGGGGFGGFGGGFGGFGGRGGGAGGGAGGGGGGAGGNRGNTAGTGGVQTRVLAVADERTNSLIVSAPDDLMPDIDELIKKIDVSASDITELRVFHLVNSDPVELATQFAELFPDDTKSTDQNQNGFRFNGGGFRGFGAPAAAAGAAGATSDRMKKKGRVMAVPDPRTSSIIVSAASELMPQIAMMVEQIDKNPAKKQRVFVYSLENADVQQAQQILSGLFQRTTTSTQNRNQNQNSVLTTRENANQQTTPSSGSSFGTGSGNSGGRTTGSGLQ